VVIALDHFRRCETLYVCRSFSTRYRRHDAGAWQQCLMVLMVISQTMSAITTILTGDSYDKTWSFCSVHIICGMLYAVISRSLDYGSYGLFFSLQSFRWRLGMLLQRESKPVQWLSPKCQIRVSPKLVMVQLIDFQIWFHSVNWNQIDFVENLIVKNFNLLSALLVASSLLRNQIVMYCYFCT